MKKLVVGITAPGSVILIKGQLKYFKELGYKTYLLAPNHERVTEYCKLEGCEHLPVDIERDISPKKDLKALVQIYRHFKRIKPDVVNLGTPKVSLLGMLAAKVVGVNRRIYTCRGFRFEHETGKKRSILVTMEKLTSKIAHNIICISQSVKDLGVAHDIFPADKAVVINKGSSNGIDLERFEPSKVAVEATENLKKELGIIKGNFVFGFVGRLVDRKGVKELYTAFSELYEKDSNMRLLVVGPIEYDQISDKTLIDKMNQHQAIYMVGTQHDVPLYLSVMDVFVLPAWWEGFGNVSVQAAAMGVAVIGTDVTGSKDAVSKDYNGLLIPAKSVETLKEAMMKLHDDTELRAKLGKNGIEWAKNFKSEVIWSGMDELFKSK